MDPSHRPDTLTGKYRTDRKMIGSTALDSRLKPRYGRFEDGDRALSATVSG